jgi:hypothetical protein
VQVLANDYRLCTAIDRYANRRAKLAPGTPQDYRHQGARRGSYPQKPAALVEFPRGLHKATDRPDIAAAPGRLAKKTARFNGFATLHNFRFKASRDCAMYFGFDAWFAARRLRDLPGYLLESGEPAPAGGWSKPDPGFPGIGN